MNYFKEAEYILSNYPKLCIALSNLQKRQFQLINISAPSSNIPAGILEIGSGSNCSNNAERELTELADVINNIFFTEHKIKEIETLITHLDEEKQKVIKLCFFEDNLQYEILEKMNISGHSSLYRKKNKAIEEFSILYFGAQAMTYFTNEKNMRKK
jgi:hypothetical protein